MSLKSAVLILEITAFPGRRFLGTKTKHNKKIQTNPKQTEKPQTNQNNNNKKSSIYQTRSFVNCFSAYLHVIPLQSGTLCSYILANCNSWSLNFFLILPMIHPSPARLLRRGHVSRTRCCQVTSRWGGRRSFPRARRSCRAGKGCGRPSESMCGCRPLARSCVTLRDCTSQRFRKISSFGGISLPFPPHSMCYKTSTAKLSQINIQLCVKFLFFFFFFLLSCIRGVVLNNSYQFIIF